MIGTQIRNKLIALENSIADRIDASYATSVSHKVQKMRDLYTHRAQGQNDALEMLRSTINLLDLLGLFEEADNATVRDAEGFLVNQ